MVKGQIEQLAHIAAEDLRRQRLGEKCPCAGVPVIGSEQELPFLYIDHTGAGGVSRHMDDLRCKPAQIDDLLAKRFWLGYNGRKIGFLIHSKTFAPGRIQDPGACGLCRVLGKILQILRKHPCFPEIARPQRMVVVSVSQNDPVRQGRDLLYSLPDIFDAIACIHQQGFPLPHQQGLADAHTVGYVVYAR